MPMDKICALYLRACIIISHLAEHGHLPAGGHFP